MHLESVFLEVYVLCFSFLQATLERQTSTDETDTGEIHLESDGQDQILLQILDYLACVEVEEPTESSNYE